MCVIFATQETRPTNEQVAAAYAANPRGAGIAYRTEENGVKGVRWKKGMNLEQAQLMARTAPLPYVLHFRIPSVGPDKPEYNHPFVIGPNADIDLEGFTTNNVLFHNGTWMNWRAEVQNLARFYGKQLPLKDWSDSRAMAFGAYCGGLGLLTFVDERVVVFGPDMLEIFNPSVWSRVDKGFWASNMGWSYRVKTSYTGSESDKKGPAMKSAEVLLPAEDDDIKVALDETDEQPRGAARPTTFPDADLPDAVDGGMAAVFGGGNQQEHAEGRPEGVHHKVEAGGLDPIVLAEEQKGLRAWIARLQPKRWRASEITH